MKIRFASGVCGIALALAGGHVGAQELRRVHFTGLISDYSPSTVSGGPYEIRGQWSLDLVGTGAALFAAYMNMETSD